MYIAGHCGHYVIGGAIIKKNRVGETTFSKQKNYTVGNGEVWKNTLTRMSSFYFKENE